MTFIFAALLGNVLAWCAHAFTWRLRASCLDFLLVLGGFVALFYNVVLFAIWNDNANGHMMPPLWWHALMTFAFVLPVLVGAWHRFNSEMRQVSLTKSTLAFYAELGIAAVIYFIGALLIFWSVVSVIKLQIKIAPLTIVFSSVYGATWLACAIFRKPLISAWRFARQSIKP